jgi:hypothetical protein
MDSYLVTLRRDEYQSVLSKMNLFKTEETVQFFKNLPLFHYLTRAELAMVATRCQLRKFVTNTLILRQDD